VVYIVKFVAVNRTHGGMGYSSECEKPVQPWFSASLTVVVMLSDHVERYLREVFVPRIAPVSREMIL
jgi:hypothetical protein